MRKILIMALAIIMTSCEKQIISDKTTTDDEDANVRISFTPYLQEPFTRSTMVDWCTRVTIAVFDETGQKVKNFTQTSGDERFGEVAIQLPAGIYKVVAVAHASSEGNATITSTEKVTFASNKMTDTFALCDTMLVGDAPVAKSMTLYRRVAMFRVTMTGGTVPDDIDRLKFYYTGGSSTLNPTTGYGCVNSKQTEYRNVRDGSGNIVTTYELFTFPHEQTDQLKMTITALTAEGEERSQWTMADIPITLNRITSWTGTLFNGTNGAVTQGAVTLTVDATWGGESVYNY